MTTAHALRAKRAREFQAALQDALRVERSVQSQLAPVARAWRTSYKRLEKAAARYNKIVEPLASYLTVSIESVPTPAALLETLRSAATFELEPVMRELREAGPQLHELPTGKEQRELTRYRKDQQIANYRKEQSEALAAERHKLEGVIADLEERLTNDAMLDHFRQGKNATQRMEGKREYTLDEYREVTRGYIRQAREKLAALR